MDLIDTLNALASRASKQLASITTEEATKNALIMPMINALGYNVFDPFEVVPEFTADVGTKKGEKVDYAINIDGKPMILIECKAVGSPLSIKHASQLFRYFAVCEARFAILTNGIEYQFYTDIEAPNKMDEKPFFVFSLLEMDDKTAAELKKFSKMNFNLDAILSNASEMKYTKQIQKVIADQIENPSDDFTRFFVAAIYDGKITSSIKEQFKPLVKAAFRSYIRETINERLKTAMDGTKLDEVASPVDEASAAPKEEDGIETTAEEIEGYHIVRALLGKHVKPNRIIMRDTKSYCGILLDDNNRKPLCRLRFNSSQKYISLMDADKNEAKMPIESLDDLYQYEEQLVECLKRYEGGN